MTTNWLIWPKTNLSGRATITKDWSFLNLLTQKTSLKLYETIMPLITCRTIKTLYIFEYFYIRQLLKSLRLVSVKSSGYVACKWCNIHGRTQKKFQAVAKPFLLLILHLELNSSGTSQRVLTFLRGAAFKIRLDDDFVKIPL